MGIYFKITAEMEGIAMSNDYCGSYYIEDTLYAKRYHLDGWEELRDDYLAEQAAAQAIELTEEMEKENV